MEIMTIQKEIHTAPRKLMLVADVVRKLKPLQALNVLQFTNKAAALPLAKAIKTALANAKQQNLNLETLSFQSLEINEGESLKRRRFAARGRTRPYKKRTSQIRIVLNDQKKGEK